MIPGWLIDAIGASRMIPVWLMTAILGRRMIPGWKMCPQANGHMRKMMAG